jgi:hypothetical protein
MATACMTTAEILKMTTIIVRGYEFSGDGYGMGSDSGGLWKRAADCLERTGKFQGGSS